MTSDSAPPLSQAIIPTWTGLHIFSITGTKSSGEDFGVKFTPTYNQTSTAGAADIFSNRTETAIGSGSQFLLEMQTAAADKFTVDRTGLMGLVAGIDQTFNPNTTHSGLNVGSFAGDPSSLVNGDVWYNSTTPALNARVNGSTVNIGGGAAAANPTGTIGLTAVNGTAGTFLRSDGAPQLSQAITPTWTGLHTYTAPGGNSAIRINASSGNPGMRITGNSSTGNSDGLLILAGTNSSDQAFQVVNQANTTVYFTILGNSDFEVLGTAAGSTGAQTINQPTGTVQFAGAATSLVVTDSLCKATSKLFGNLLTNDATAVLGAFVPAAGSFTINMKTAPTGTTVVSFWVVN